MIPLFSSPCDLAGRIPTMAADFLELETKVGRRFREDSVTDLLIASLLKIGGNDATVFTPPETITGGDFDLVIYKPETGEGIQYRIQSKRLVVNSSNWAWSSYRELDHPHGSGKQASTLIRSSAQEKVPTVPLYAFYNPFSVCEASGNEIAGIQLADGRAISAIVRALVKARREGKRPRWKRLEYLRHLFFPLSTILCPADEESLSANQIIQPEVSRQAAQTAIAERQLLQSTMDDANLWLNNEVVETPSLPPPNQVATASHSASLSVPHPKPRGIPKIIERAINREPDKPSIQRARVRRPKLVLLSR